MLEPFTDLKPLEGTNSSLVAKTLLHVRSSQLFLFFFFSHLVLTSWYVMVPLLWHALFLHLLCIKETGTVFFYIKAEITFSCYWSVFIKMVYLWQALLYGFLWQAEDIWCLTVCLYVNFRVTSGFRGKKCKCSFTFCEGKELFLVFQMHWTCVCLQMIAFSHALVHGIGADQHTNLHQEAVDMACVLRDYPRIKSQPHSIF